MKLRHTHALVVIVALSVLLSCTLTTAANATPRYACQGPCIDGGYQGSGTHFTNGSGGAGSRGGYSAVRYDAFVADPSYTTCNNPRREYFDDLDVAANFPGPFYLHRRVAVARNAYQIGGTTTVPNETVVGGVQPNILMTAGPGGTPLDFNADYGTTRPSTGSTTGPTQSNPWISPFYADPPICLPLKAGADVLKELEAATPVVDLKPAKKPFVRMKNSYISISVDERQINASGVGLSFDLTNIKVLVCDKAKEVPGTLAGCRLGDDKKSPIYVDPSKVQITRDPANAETVLIKAKVKYKKKGNFVIAIGAVYDGTSTVNAFGVNSSTTTTGISAWATTCNGDPPGTPCIISVRTSKAVNRKG